MEYFENIELLDHLLYLLMPEFSAVDIETIIPLGDDDYEEVRERCIFFNRYYNDGIFLRYRERKPDALTKSRSTSRCV